MSGETVLCIKNFTLDFERYDSPSFFHKTSLRIITQFDISLKQGELLAVVGSSGAGKSLLAHAILGILPASARTSGEIHYRGQILNQKRLINLRRRHIVLLPQSVTFLNPLSCARAHIFRSALLSGKTPKKAATETDQALAFFGLDGQVKKLYPFQLSGGMARRVLAAAAYVTGAELFIADEPTNGLDEDAATESLQLIKKLVDDGKSVMLITHDLQAALKVASKVAVFYGGTVVETTVPKCFKRIEELKHPYSQALFKALPEQGFNPLPGENPLTPLPGCVFEPRCPLRGPDCRLTAPEYQPHANGLVRCFYA